MIDLTQNQLAKLLLEGLLLGVALGVFYDCIRFFKCFFTVGVDIERIRYRGVLGVAAYAFTFFTDVILMLLAALTSILLLYSVDGVFRGMTYPAMAAGFLLYYHTVGRAVLKLSKMLVKALKRLIKRLFAIAIRPIRAIWRLIISVYHLTIGRFLGKIKERVKSAREKRARTEIEEQSAGDGQPCGKEDLVYVDGKAGYKREGRISFTSERG